MRENVLNQPVQAGPAAPQATHGSRLVSESHTANVARASSFNETCSCSSSRMNDISPLQPFAYFPIVNDAEQHASTGMLQDATGGIWCGAQQDAAAFQALEPLEQWSEQYEMDLPQLVEPQHVAVIRTQEPVSPRSRPSSMDSTDSTSDHSPLLLQYGSARAAVVDGTPMVPIANAPPQWLHGTLRLPQFTLHEPVYLADDRNFSDEDVPAGLLPLDWREPPEFTTGESRPIHPSVQHARAGLGLDFTPVANTNVQHTPPDVTSTAKLPKKLRHED